MALSVFNLSYGSKMGPILVIDKSAFQSFSANELTILTRYFTINIPPVFVVEVIADLTKNDGESVLNTEGVKKIAQKIHSKDTNFNQYYREILVGSLIYRNLKLEHAKIVINAQAVKNSIGQIGFKAEVSPEEIAFNKWKRSDFSFDDEVLALKWRQLTDEIDLDELISKLRKSPIFHEKLKSLDDVVKKVDNFLKGKNSIELLEILAEDFGLSVDEVSPAFYKLESNNYRSFKELSGYAYFCLKVVTTFYFSLVNELITKRPTNRVDLEYIFYLPFCNGFVSNDKFHKRIVPLVLQDYNEFILGSDLKKDLAKIYKFTQENNHPKYLKFPPKLENSIVSQLWDKYTTGVREEKNDFFSKMTKEDKEELLSKLNRFTENTTNLSNDGANSEIFEDHEFFIREREVPLSDPCICGSGIPFKDCCFKKYKNQK